MNPLLPDAIANFHKVDSHLYRGAQPDLAAYPLLKEEGIELIINLRNDPLPMEPQVIANLGDVQYVNVPMSGLGRPKDSQVNEVLDTVIRFVDKGHSVYVHCEHGNDRTGVIIACYRIRHDGWTNHQALAEAEMDHMSWIELAMKDFVEDYSLGRLATKPVEVVA